MNAQLLPLTALLLNYKYDKHGSTSGNRTKIPSFQLEQIANSRKIGFQSTKKDSQGNWSFSMEKVSVIAAQGEREYMEDRFDIILGVKPESFINYYAIYDGHGGHLTADLAETLLLDNVASRISASSKLGDNLNWTRILTEEVMSLDNRMRDAFDGNLTVDHSGSTALIAVQLPSRELIIANLGDSRAVMCNKAGQAMALTIDHKPNDKQEYDRLISLGGYIEFFGVWRVQGVLATSRALGNFFLKTPQPYVNSMPEIWTFKLDNVQADFIVLASDGLWDVVENQEVVEIVLDSLQNGKTHLEAAEIVLKTALTRQSKDNITVMVVDVSN